MPLSPSSQGEYHRRPGWRAVSADDLIFQGEGWLFSVSGLLAAGGKVLTLYDAGSAMTGREIVVLYSPANQSMQLHFDPPLPLGQGLYVDLESSALGVVVQYLRDPGLSLWRDFYNMPPAPAQ